MGEIDAHIVLSSSAATEWTLAAVKKAVDAFSEYFEADGYGISSSTVDRLVCLSFSADIHLNVLNKSYDCMYLNDRLSLG